MSDQVGYELRYLRAVMEWLDEGGCYEPHAINDLHRDWKDNVQQGKESTARVRDFASPARAVDSEVT